MKSESRRLKNLLTKFKDISFCIIRDSMGFELYLLVVWRRPEDAADNSLDSQTPNSRPSRRLHIIAEL